MKKLLASPMDSTDDLRRVLILKGPMCLQAQLEGDIEEGGVLSIPVQDGSPSST